jgi:HlyD family secretion protein
MSEAANNHSAPAPSALPPTGDRPASLAERVRSLRLPEHVNKPRPKGGSTLPWVLCALLALSTAGLGVYAFSPKTTDTPGDSPETTAARLSTGAGVVASSGDVVLESKGYIIPAHQIQVSPKVSGMVTELSVVEGKWFEKGEVLAELEDIDYKADADRAQATLEMAKHRLVELQRNQPDEIRQAEADMAESQAQLKMLKLEWERNRRLLTANTALAMRDYEQAESQYRAMERHVQRLAVTLDVARNGPRLDRIRAADAEVRQAQADLDKARWRLENCKVVAPISGTILTKKAEKGNIVNPIAFNVSASLCDMADLGDLEVDLYIQERDIAQVEKEQKCRVAAEAWPNRPPYKGVVSRLMPTADRAKGAIPVRVKVDVPRDEAGVFLKPDMSVIVSFLKTK